MKKHIFRILAAVLALAIIVCAFAGCNYGGYDWIDTNYLIETSMEMLSAMPEETIIKSVMTPIDILNCIIMILNQCRKKFLETQDKHYWWQMIQLLPTSYNQKRTVMLNYEVLTNIYHYRKDHKLDEWHDFCDMIRGLPYAKELIIGEETK